MENVVIIGSGPAGLSAAIYLARAGLKPLVFAGSPAGGQLTLTSEVENYPGFESILGLELVGKMRKQAEKFGARVVDENVVKVDFSKKPFRIFGNWKMGIKASQEARSKKLDRKNPSSKHHLPNPLPDPSSNFIPTKSVIIATGAKALWLNVPGEKRLLGKGVSACAVCDGFFFRDKIVAVVGGGDTAMEETLTLTKFAKKVYLIHRRDSFRASKIMQERVKKHPKIEIIYDAVVEEIRGERKVEGIKIRKLGIEASQDGGDKKLDKKNPASNNQLPNPLPNLPSNFQLKVDGIFIAIGHKPDTKIFEDHIEMDKKGYIITTNFSTSIKGVFAAGDCIDNKYRQAAVAAGMGVSAALETERWLEEK